MLEQEEGILLDTAVEPSENEDSLLLLLGMQDEYENSLNMMRVLAQKGDQQAILWMGMYYMHRDGWEPDVAEAFYWLNKSNDAAAKVQMAQIYEKDGDKESSLVYYEEAVAAASDASGDMKATALLSLASGYLPLDIEKAQAYLLQLLKLDGSEDDSHIVPPDVSETIPDVMDALCRRLMLAKQTEQAIRWTELYLKYRPDSEDGKKRLELLRNVGQAGAISTDTQRSMPEKKPTDAAAQDKTVDSQPGASGFGKLGHYVRRIFGRSGSSQS